MARAAAWRTALHSTPGAAKHTREVRSRFRPSDGYEKRITCAATCMPRGRMCGSSNLCTVVVAVVAAMLGALACGVDAVGSLGDGSADGASNGTTTSGMMNSPVCTESFTPNLRRKWPAAYQSRTEQS